MDKKRLSFFLIGIFALLANSGVSGSPFPQVKSKTLHTALERYKAALEQIAKEYDLRFQTAQRFALRAIEKEIREQTRDGNLALAESLLKIRERVAEIEKVPCRAGDRTLKKATEKYTQSFRQQTEEALTVFYEKTKQAGKMILPIIRQTLDSAQYAGDLKEVMKLKQLRSDIEQVRVNTSVRCLWLDLPSEVEIERDRLNGKWIAVPEGLQGFNGFLAIPLRVEGDYQISLTFTRHQGPNTSAVEVDVPIGRDQRVNIVLDGYGKSHYTGFSRIRTETGEMVNNNGLGKKILLENDREYALEITVLQQPQSVSIDVLLDGQPLMNWQGPAEVIITEDSPRIRLSAGFRTRVTFHQVMLRVLNGCAIFDPRQK